MLSGMLLVELSSALPAELIGYFWEVYPCISSAIRQMVRCKFISQMTVYDTKVFHRGIQENN